jgi:hypothetical protein
MGTSLADSVRTFGLRERNLKEVQGLASIQGVNSVSSSRQVHSQISPPSTPIDEVASRHRIAGSDHSSDIAPEIIVWTEDMDVDQSSQNESEDLSSLEEDAINE